MKCELYKTLNHLYYICFKGLTSATKIVSTKEYTRI